MNVSDDVLALHSQICDIENFLGRIDGSIDRAVPVKCKQALQGADYVLVQNFLSFRKLKLPIISNILGHPVLKLYF